MTTPTRLTKNDVADLRQVLADALQSVRDHGSSSWDDWMIEKADAALSQNQLRSALTNTSGDDEAPVAWRYRHKEWSEDFWNYFTKEPRYKEDDEIWQGLYARPQSAAVRDVWKPIETAPKDGTAIILALSTGRVVVGHWLDNSKTQWPWAGWSTDAGPYLDKSVTHWMPMPSAPDLSKSKVA